MEVDYAKGGGIYARIFLLIILILLSACDIASKTNTPDLGSPNAPTFITDTGEDAAGPVAISVVENTQVPTDVPMFAEDVDGNAINWKITTAPTKGTVVMEPDNSPGELKTFSYLPDTDAIGDDIFEISIDDGTGYVDTMTVNVTIAARESFVSVEVLGYSTGNALVLQLNGENNMPVSSDGTYTFNTVLNSGDTYNVTTTTTTEQLKTSCVFGNAVGTMSSSNPTNVDLVCKDTVAPNIINQTPAADEEKVALGTIINAVFDENMLATSMGTGAVSLVSPADPVTPVSGTTNYTEPSRTLSFAPSVPLAGLLRPYTVTLSPDITDISGQPLASSSWTFTTPDGNWGTAETIVVEETIKQEQIEVITQRQFTMNSAGQALVVWPEFTPTPVLLLGIEHLYSVHFDPESKAWASAKRIDDGDPETRYFRWFNVGLDSKGRGLAVWEQVDYEVGATVRFKRFDPDLNEWEEKSVVIESIDPLGLVSPKFVMNSDGRGIAVVDTKTSIVAIYFDPETNTWELGDIGATAGAHSPQIAINSKVGVAVWVQPDSEGVDNIWVNYFDLDPGSAAKGWGEAGLIGRTDQASGSKPLIALNSFGQGVVVWRQWGQYDLVGRLADNIWANYFDAETRTWGNKNEAVLLETLNGDASPPSIALDSLGGGLTTWRQDDEAGVSTIFSNYFDPVKKEWGEAKPIPIESGTIEFGSPQVVLDPAGQGFAVWSGEGAVWVKRFDSADKSWSSAEIIGLGENAQWRNIALDAMGRGIAIWDTGGYIGFNRFE